MLPKVTILTSPHAFVRSIFFNLGHHQNTIIYCQSLVASTLATLAITTLALSPAHSAESDISISQKQIHTRTLAASCAACHGTLGNSLSITPVLAGLDPTYFVKQMLAFRTGDRDSTVMHHHARGLTIDEIDALANYFSVQRRSANAAVSSEILKHRDE
jgi:cytochrome c553